MKAWAVKKKGDRVRSLNDLYRTDLAASDEAMNRTRGGPYVVVPVEITELDQDGEGK